MRPECNKMLEDTQPTIHKSEKDKRVGHTSLGKMYSFCPLDTGVTPTRGQKSIPGQYQGIHPLAMCTVSAPWIRVLPQHEGRSQFPVKSRAYTLWHHVQFLPLGYGCYPNTRAEVNSRSILGHTPFGNMYISAPWIRVLTPTNEGRVTVNAQ